LFWQRPMHGPVSIAVGSEWQRTRCYEWPASAWGARMLRAWHRRRSGKYR
jgi:hypothetical protein